MASKPTRAVATKQPYKVSRLTLLVISFTIFLSFLLIPISIDGETNDYFFCGGLLGMFSSSIVIYKMLRKGGTASRSLLMYRALCDFGIGLRFVLSPIFMKDVCGQSRCSVNEDTDVEHKCSLASGMIQFFEMASEAWFLCLAYDLAVTITNPFSSSASRVWGYHAFCWCIASVFAVAIIRIDGMAGFWFVGDGSTDDVPAGFSGNGDVDDVAICWIQQQSGGGLNTKTFLFLYIPLFVVYCYAVRVIWGAYNNLKKGISKTFQHRVKVLVLNSINIGIYVLYWFVLFLFYFWAYFFASDNRALARGFWKLLWFFLSSKGFADLLVFIFISDDEVKNDDEATAVDFNAALRQEVLHYATTGIRECASKATDQMSKNKLVLIMHQKNTPLKSIFNFKALVKVVFSGEQLNPQENNNTTDTDSLQVLETETTEIDEEGGRPTSRMSRRFSRNTITSISPPPRSDLEHEDVTGEGRTSSTSQSSSSNYKIRSTDGSDNVTKSIRMGGLTSSSSLGNDVSGKASFDCAVDDTDDDVEEYESGWTKFKNIVSAPVNFYSKFSLNRFSDVSVEFVEFEPYYFRQIRLHDNVQDFDYINSFMKTIKERLTEGGASGAFFFFTKDERFIAKSCTTDEIAHIRRSAHQMEKYLSENPASFITKIYGAYKIQIYGTSFYFFVMNNIFLNPGNEVINEKYDLKGSWVKRNSTPPQIGERVTCTHCNQKYVFTNLKKGDKKGKKKKALQDDEMNKCRMQVFHEPNVILKDNDLKYKLRLPNATSKHLITQLHKDTEFLCGLGVMDYSLLVGVHNTEYQVDEEMGRMHSPSKPPPLIEEDSPSQRKPHRRKTLSTKQTSFGPSNSKEDLTALEKSPGAGLNGRMAVSRIVGPEAYYMGIVDFQQKYDFGKKMERFFKVQIQGKSGDGLSCIEPVTYRERFLNRMEDLVDFDTQEQDNDPVPAKDRSSSIQEEEDDEYNQC